MLRFSCLISTAICVAVSTDPSVGYAGTIRHDRADELYTGLAADADFASVGKITWTESAGSFLASGTLIAGQWVLTAAHVVDGNDGSGGGISNLQFDAGGSSYAADQWVPHPEWATSGGEQNLFAGWDIGLVRLSSAVTNVVPTNLYISENELGQVATLVGFGATGTGLTGAQSNTAGTKRAGQNVVDISGTEETPGSIVSITHDRMLAVDFDQPGVASESTLGDPEPLDLEYITAPGDSGGGLFLEMGDQQLLAGVTSLSSTLDQFANSDYGDRAAFTRVSQFIDWIEQTVLVNSPPVLPGDYNGNGIVGASDYSVWKSSFGSNTLLSADGNNNGIVDAADYTIWRDNLGATTAGGGAALATVPGKTVPEPATGPLAAAASFLIATSAVYRSRLMRKFGRVRQAQG